jgi:hypothetical protein
VEELFGAELASLLKFCPLRLSSSVRGVPRSDIVLVRLEMLAPFPHDRLTSVLREYPNADVVWCQVRSLKISAQPSRAALDDTTAA